MTLLNLSRILLSSWVCTIALGPIYWLPFADRTITATVKLILLFNCLATALLMLSSIKIRQKLFSYMKIPNIFFALIFFIMTFGFWVSADENRFSLKANEFNFMAYSFMLAYMIFSSSLILAAIRRDYFKLLLYPSIFIIIMSTIHVATVLLNFNIEHVEVGKVFKETGFGSLRTGWSNGLALFVIVIPAYVSARKESNIKKIFFSFFYGSFPILFSQGLSGGRTGLLASLIAVILFGLYILPKKYFISFPILLILVFASPFSLPNKMTDTISNLMNPNEYNEKEIDRNLLSVKYRIDHFLFSLERIYESPIIGNGIGNAIHPPTNLEIHNVFLKAGAELGLPYMILLFSFPIYLFILLKRALKTNYSKNELLRSRFRSQVVYLVSSGITVLSGLFISLLEPRYIYGGLGVSWAWWVSAAFLIFNAKTLYPIVSFFSQQKAKLIASN